MSIDDIRHILFEVRNQEMSVRDLRWILFEIKDSDKEKTNEELVEDFRRIK